MSLAELAVAPGRAGREEASCAHCGLPVPAQWGRGGDGPQFCCSGCLAAHRILSECGLDGFYALPDRRGVPVEPSRKGFEEFDHPAFQALYVRPTATGLRETSLLLEGVRCASCVWLVERLPLAVPGFAAAELDVVRSRVRLVWAGADAQLSDAARFLDSLGYPPHPDRGLSMESLRRKEGRAMLARIGIAGAIAGNVMMIALAMYSGWFGGIDAAHEQFFRWVSLLMVTPAVFGPGLVFFRGALGSLRARTLHMDVPVAVAIGAGYLRGAVNTFLGHGPIYFDGVAALIFLLLVGRFLQMHAQRGATDSAELLHSLAPSTARIVDEAGTRDVPSEALLPGMQVEVRPGETLPADGTVLLGSSALDQSLLSGEPRPVSAGPGSLVYAGTVNRTSTLRVLVERAGESSRVGGIMAQVEQASRRRAPVALMADRMAGLFVAVVLGLAVLTAVGWLRASPDRAIDNAIALLIVTCPCALALATPLAVTVGIGQAARAGLLIKGGSALETLARGGVMFLDKTGTVTEGVIRLARWEGPEWVKPLVVAVERESNHPVASGFCEAWPAVAPAAAAEVRHEAGGGIEAWIGGRCVRVGSPVFAGDDFQGVAAGADLTPVSISVDGEVVARASFRDRIRPEAREAIFMLREMGWRVRLLSGDHPEVVREIGARLGIGPEDCTGGASPEDKLSVIERERARGPVVMVGDGVNDAAAIAGASVGVGVRGGAEACLSAADVFLARPGLHPLVELVRGSRSTLGVIHRNILFSIGYNVLGAGLAMTGVIDPLIAAVLMPVSSLTVVLASWRSRSFREARP